MLTIKRGIREAEAVSGIETFGMRREQARFLNLPFYQTGKVRKDPIGPEDVAITLELLEEHRPSMIFVAGDLSDPHGTHRMCLETVQRALEQYTGDQPEMWYYRGAWQEWEIAEAGRAGAALGRRAAGEEDGDLQAPEPEGPRALPRSGRPGILATRGRAEQAHRGSGRPAWAAGVLRDGGVRGPPRRRP